MDTITKQKIKKNLNAMLTAAGMLLYGTSKCIGLSISLPVSMATGLWLTRPMMVHPTNGERLCSGQFPHSVPPVHTISRISKGRD